MPVKMEVHLVTVAKVVIGGLVADVVIPGMEDKRLLD
jgi:hypothetical protein